MKKAKMLRVAVIGAGSVAKYRHLPEYAANTQVKIVAVCDKVHANAEKLAKALWREALLPTGSNWLPPRTSMR